MRIAMLLSGGVDSSTALYQLQRRHPEAEIHAYYLKIWLEDELAYLGDCPWEEDLSYARAVCEQLSVPLHISNLQKDYFDRVVSYTIDELKAGRTPSPDIFCNQRIKFGTFLDAVADDYDLVASGHYAQLERDEHGRTHLLQAPDPVKDQTYFLSQLSQTQLSRLIFPIGGMMKQEVRELASRAELATCTRPDSQGICFLGKLKYRDFVAHYLGTKEGAIVEQETGEELGTHKGFWFHTVGQRQGLGLSGGPWYVSGKDLDRNIVYVSHSSELGQGRSKRLRAGEASWTLTKPEPGRYSAKLRHGPAMMGAELHYTDEGYLDITLDAPDRGLAPGQFAVLYRGEECLGSAKILEDLDAAASATTIQGAARA